MAENRETAPRLQTSQLRLLLATIFCTWAWYCHHWPFLHTANEAMRLYFVQAVADTGRPELDAIVKRHRSLPVDRSEYGGHIYMDKAPGTSLLALPLYPIARAAQPSIERQNLWQFGYLATLWTSALPLLAALWLLGHHLRRHGVADGATWLTLAALATASPLLVYATLLFGHALAAASIAGGFLLIARSDPFMGPTRRQALLAGLLLGWAGLTDTPVFVLAALVGLFAAARCLPWPHLPRRMADLQLGERLRRTWPIIVGIAVGVGVQLAYNQWTLGHPLRFTYQFKGDRALAAIMQTGALGFRPPQPDALWGLLMSAKRGLLYHAPWLAVAAVGLGWTATRKNVPQYLRIEAGGALAIAVVYALFVSGFADWPAGDSAGPRHLLPIVPLLGWGLAFVWQAEAAWWLRPTVAATLAGSVLLHLPTVATFPYHFEQLERPVLELGVPLIVQAAWSPSIGGWLGMSGTASALVFVLAIALVWLLALRAPQETPVRKPTWRYAMVAATALLLWATGLAASVPERPGRAAEVARFQAARLMQRAIDGAGARR